MTERTSPGVNEIPSERALLGALLQSATRLPDVDEVLTPDDFYRPEHGALFSALVEMARQGIAVDVVTATAWLASHQLAERCGGLPYVAELPEHAPSTENVLHYARTVRRAAELRRLFQLAPLLAAAAQGDGIERAGVHLEPASEPLVIGEAVSAAILGIVSRTERTEGTADDVVEVMAEIHATRASDKPPGLPTGIRALDAILDGGPRPTDLVVVCGRPAMGKTSLAMNITEHLVADHGVAVGWFSMEMSRKQLLQRLLSTVANIPLQLLRNPQGLNTTQLDDLTYCAGEIRRWPLFIDDRAGLTMSQMRAQAIRWKLRGVKMIIVDYLQLCGASDPRQNKVDAVGDISKGSKKLAKDLEIVSVLLSQLNRKLEERADKRPIQSDLRDSGQIEQDADAILACYRESVYDPTARPEAAELILNKYRHGPIDTAHVAYDGAITKFRDYAETDLL